MQESERDAYSAGLFDGEGCVGVYKRRSGKYVRYHMKVSVKMTHRKTVERFKSLYGGHISFPKIFGNRQKAYVWEISCTAAIPFLKKILPYSITKALHIALAIQFQENLVMLANRLVKTTPEMMDAKEKIAQEFRQLNKRGIQ